MYINALILSHAPKTSHEHGQKARNLGPDTAQNDSAEVQVRQSRTFTHEDQVTRCEWQSYVRHRHS